MAKSKKRKASKAIGLKGAVEMAAAGLGLASMVYEAYRGYQGSAALKEGDRDRVAASGEGGPGLGFADAAARAIRRDAGQAHARRSDEGLQPDTGTAVRALGAAGTAAAILQALADLNRASPDLLSSLIGKKRAHRITGQPPLGRAKDLKKILPKRVYKVVKRQLAT
jgi:hypothetical protein